MLHYLLREVPHGAVLGDMPADTVIDTNQTNEATTDEINLVTPEKFRPQSVVRRHRPVSPASSISSYASKDHGIAEATKTSPKSCEELVKGIQRSFQSNTTAANPTGKS